MPAANRDPGSGSWVGKMREGRGGGAGEKEELKEASQGAQERRLQDPQRLPKQPWDEWHERMVGVTGRIP